MPQPDRKSLNFLAFVPDSESLSVLQRFALAQGWETGCAQQGTVDDAVKYLSNHPSPDFLLVDVPSAEAAPKALDRLADVCAPKTRVIVTSTVDEFSFFRWLTDIGVHAYLLKPLTEETLQGALAAKQEERAASSENAAKQSGLIAVMGTRGGVGASTVALNFAAAIGHAHATPTALLDLQPQWGTLSLMLDLEPGRGMRDALAKPDRIDGLFMERVMLKYNPHLAVLSSEEPFDEPMLIHNDAASALLRESRKKFAVTVADLPRELTSFTLEILTQADHILVVTELSLISLRDAMRLHDFLKEKLGAKNLHFIANRQGMLPKYDMPQAEFEKSLGAKCASVIPFDAEVYAKTATGEVAVLKKQPTPMGKALLALAETLHGAAAKTEPQKKAGVLGWLKKPSK